MDTFRGHLALYTTAANMLLHLCVLEIETQSLGLVDSV